MGTASGPGSHRSQQQPPKQPPPPPSHPMWTWQPPKAALGLAAPARGAGAARTPQPAPRCSAPQGPDGGAQWCPCPHPQQGWEKATGGAARRVSSPQPAATRLFSALTSPPRGNPLQTNQAGVSTGRSALITWMGCTVRPPSPRALQHLPSSRTHSLDPLPFGDATKDATGSPSPR